MDGVPPKMLPVYREFGWLVFAQAGTMLLAMEIPTASDAVFRITGVFSAVNQNLNETFNPPPASNWWYDGAVLLSEFLMS